MTQLSAGSCIRIHNTQPEDEEVYTTGHTLQFLSVKKVQTTTAANQQATDRYRIIVSDGEHFIQAMLATQLNNLVEDGSITRNTVAVVDKLTCNTVQGKRLTIILELRVISNNEEKIGSPVAIPGVTAPAGALALPANSAGATGGNSNSSASAPPQKRNNQDAQKGRSNILPIEGLSPYQNNWTLRVRVTQKSEVRTWSNQRGEGKLFSVTFADDSGEIKGTAFNDVVEELYDRLEEGKVYYVSKARVNLAKKKFNNVNNDYELSLERATEVEECHDGANIGMPRYNFVALSELESVPKDSICDVIGIIKDVGNLGEIISKNTNKVVQKRELTLVDMSNFSVRLTLWGKQAEQFVQEDSPVIAFKGVKVGDFGGRSLSMFSSSTMAINPDLKEAHELRGWYDREGASKSFQAHSTTGGSSMVGFNRDEVRSLHDVKESSLGASEKPEYFSARATIMHIKSDNISYPACPSQGCNKKVVEDAGQWRCERCDKSFDKPEHRYIVSFAVADWSGQAWLQGFNDAGLVVFDKSADEMQHIKETDDAEYNVLMHKANCATFNFACRAKQDTYQDQTRVRYGISRILPLDYREEACHLRDLLHSPWGR